MNEEELEGLKKTLQRCMALLDGGSIISASEEIKKVAIKLDEEGLGRTIRRIRDAGGS